MRGEVERDAGEARNGRTASQATGASRAGALPAALGGRIKGWPTHAVGIRRKRSILAVQSLGRDQEMVYDKMQEVLCTLDTGEGMVHA